MLLEYIIKYILLMFGNVIKCLHMENIKLILMLWSYNSVINISENFVWFRRRLNSYHFFQCAPVSWCGSISRPVTLTVQ